jgi:hypothetical protein
MSKPGRPAAQERFQFGKREFNRIEIRTVGQESDVRAPAVIAARTSELLVDGIAGRTTSPGRSVGTDLLDIRENWGYR